MRRMRISWNKLSRTIGKDWFIICRHPCVSSHFFLFLIPLLIHHFFRSTLPRYITGCTVFHRISCRTNMHICIRVCSCVYVCISRIIPFRDNSTFHNLYEKRDNTCILRCTEHLFFVCNMNSMRCRSNIGG